MMHRRIAFWMTTLTGIGCAFSDSTTDPGSPPPVQDVLPSDPGSRGDLPGPTDPGGDSGGEAVFLGGAGEIGSDAQRRPYTTHVTWAGDAATQVTVQWQTVTTDTASYRPRVLFAREDEVRRQGDEILLPFDSAHVAEGAGFVYITYDNQGGEIDVVQWAVDLLGLVPATTYYYRVGSWKDIDPETGLPTGADLSPVQSFRSGHLKGDRTPFTFVTAGDSRSDDGKIAANANRLAAIPSNFWLFSGDMTEVGTQAEWWYWFDAMRPILARHVLMPVQGNHEVVADLYYNQFVLPGMAGLPPEWQEHGWSFDYGNIHVVGLDSNTEDTVASQLEWLKADLAKADADPDIDWKIVMFHHPVYSASSAHGSTLRVQKYWLPVFEQYHVDLTLTGHDHDYERTKPIRGEQVVGSGDGVVHVVAGSFYAPPYSNGRDWWTEVSHHGQTNNYLVLRVDGKRLTVTAYNGDGTQVLDEFTISK